MTAKDKRRRCLYCVGDALGIPYGTFSTPGGRVYACRDHVPLVMASGFEGFEYEGAIEEMVSTDGSD